MGLRLPLFLVLPKGTHFGIEGASARHPTIWSQWLPLMSTGMSLPLSFSLCWSVWSCYSPKPILFTTVLLLKSCILLKPWLAKKDHLLWFTACLKETLTHINNPPSNRITLIYTTGNTDNKSIPKHVSHARIMHEKTDMHVQRIWLP